MLTAIPFASSDALIVIAMTSFNWNPLILKALCAMLEDGNEIETDAMKRQLTGIEKQR